MNRLGGISCRFDRTDNRSDILALAKKYIDVTVSGGYLFFIRIRCEPIEYNVQESIAQTTNKLPIKSPMMRLPFSIKGRKVIRSAPMRPIHIPISFFLECVSLMRIYEKSAVVSGIAV